MSSDKGIRRPFTYGVTKTRNVSASIALRATFFGFDVTPMAFNVPVGVAMDEPLLVRAGRDDFAVGSDWGRGWCSPLRPGQGLLLASIYSC